MKASERRRGNMTSPVLTLLGVSAVLFISLFFMKRHIHDLRPQDMESQPPPTRAWNKTQTAENGSQTSPPPLAVTDQAGLAALLLVTESSQQNSTSMPPEDAVDETTEEKLDENPEEENQEESPEKEPEQSLEEEPKESAEEIQEESSEENSEGIPEESPQVEPALTSGTASPPELMEAEIPQTGTRAATLTRRRRHHQRQELRPWLVGQLDRDRWHQQERVQLFRMPPLP